jgi:hypothetical protein
MPLADIDRNRSAYARPMEDTLSDDELRSRLIDFYRQNEVKYDDDDDYELGDKERDEFDSEVLDYSTDHKPYMEGVLKSAVTDHDKYQFPFSTIGHAANRALKFATHRMTDFQIRQLCQQHHAMTQWQFPQATAHCHSHSNSLAA